MAKKDPVQYSEFHSADTLDNLIEVFVNIQDIKATSKEDYIKFLRQFRHWLLRRQPKEISRDVLLSYKKYLQASRKKPLTINSYLVPAKKFLVWAGYADATKDIKLEKRGKGFRRDPLTVDQSRELLSIFDLSKVQGKRDFSIINLMIRTGLRTIEVIKADIGDIRQVGGRAVLYVHGKGKGEKEDFVVLTPKSLKPIHDYLEARLDLKAVIKNKDKKPLFVTHGRSIKGKRLTTRTLRWIVKGYLRKIGINSERVSAHSLRHTAVTLALLGGASLQDAQAMARHSNINTTMIYAHNIDRVGDPGEEKTDKALD